MNEKKKILVVGKLPPPIMGPSLANKILLNSELKNKFNLVHFNITINKIIETQGEFSLKKIFRSFQLYKSYWKLIKKENPDLVLMTSFSQSIVGFYKDIPYLIFPRLQNIKVVGQLRGSNFKNLLDSTTFFNAYLIKKVLKKINGIVVLGNNLKYIFEDFVKSQKIHVIPNGSNYSFPKKNKSNTKINVLYLANLFKTKGVHNVVQSAIELNNKNCSFILAGGWSSDERFKKELLRRVDESKVDITIYPPVFGSKKLQLFSNADIFVFPPIAPEGHPWVLVEAMAAGLPIISTDQGAIVESVIDGENGFIVSPNSPDEIAEKIQYLVKNEDIRRKMGLKSKKFHLEKFSEEKMVENYSKLFNFIINVSKIN